MLSGAIDSSLVNCVSFCAIAMASVLPFWLSGSHVMFGVFLAFWGIMYLWRKEPVHTNGTERPFFLLTAAYIAAIIFSPDPRKSLPVLENLIPFVLIFLLGNISLLRHQKKILLKIWMILFTIHSLYVFGQHLSGVVRPGGTYGFMSFSHIILVPLSTGMVLFSFSKDKGIQILSIGTVLAGAAALFATMTRGAWLAFLLGILLLLVVRKKWMHIIFCMMIILAAGAVTVLAFPQSPASVAIRSTIAPFEDNSDRVGVSNYHRLYMWKASVEMALDHPLVGVGPKRFQEEYEKYRDKNVDERILREKQSHAHSIYFDALAQTGFVGLICLLIFIGSLFRALITRYRDTNADFEKALVMGAFIAVICFCIGGLTHQSFHRTMVTLNLSFIIGLALAPDKSKAHMPQASKTPEKVLTASRT